MTLNPNTRAHLEGKRCSAIGCSICIAQDGKRAFAKVEAAERLNRGPRPAPSKTDKGGQPRRRLHPYGDGTFDPGTETVTRAQYEREVAVINEKPWREVDPQERAELIQQAINDVA